MSDIQTTNASTNGAPTSSASPAAGNPPLWHATPEMDVYESGSAYLILLNVPGASPDSVDVQVVGRALHVRAAQAAAPNQADIALTAFERHLELPNDVDSNSASAKLRDGVLEIEIQKSAAARRVNIRVNAN